MQGFAGGIMWQNIDNVCWAYTSKEDGQSIRKMHENTKTVVSASEICPSHRSQRRQHGVEAEPGWEELSR